MIRLTLALLVAAAAAAPARAQIIKVPRAAEPRVWTTLGVAVYRMDGVVDGNTESVWDLDNSTAPQFRGSLEWGIRRQTSVGITASHTQLSFRYYGNQTTSSPETSCDGCRAHVDLSSLALSFHSGGGDGVHQVIEGQVGITRFANFRANDGRDLAPLGGDRDLSLTVGYGVGYTLRSGLQLTLVQDFGVLYHQSSGSSGNGSGAIQQRMTRLGVRYGLLRRKPGV